MNYEEAIYYFIGGGERGLCVAGQGDQGYGKGY